MTREHVQAINKLKEGIASGEKHIDLSRKIFLSYQTEVFRDNEDLEYVIKNNIKNHLKVPFLSIQITGSSKTGFSFFKKTKFTEGKSDLDVSIISLELYNRFLETVHKETSSFTNLSVFPNFRGERTDRQFIKNFQKGFINPFFMPNCKEKSEWLDYFRHLSNDHYKKFKSINSAIYASEYFFECKQVECIDEFERNVKAYDTLPSKV